MAALTAGVRAPEFTLPTVDGNQCLCGQALRKGRCRARILSRSAARFASMLFRLFERMYRANQGAKITVLGISQDNAHDTQAFLKQYGVSFPVALDDPANYAVSNAYGLTNVPTLFYIDAEWRN